MNNGLSPEAKLKRIEYQFDSRKRYSPENVFTVSGFDWEATTHYVLADDDWWFEKFNESPDACVGADFYWKFDGDVAFLEIAAKKTAQLNFEGELFYASWKGGRLNGILNLHALVEDDLIYSYTVERVMKKFWEFHQKSNLFDTYYLKRKLRKLE
jgi:hypothetical protein